MFELDSEKNNTSYRGTFEEMFSSAVPVGGEKYAAKHLIVVIPGLARKLRGMGTFRPRDEGRSLYQKMWADYRRLEQWRGILEDMSEDF